MLSWKNDRPYSGNNMKQTEIQTVLSFCKCVLVNFSFKNFNLSQLEEKAKKENRTFLQVGPDRRGMW